MIILDTNIFSAVMQEEPEKIVIRWLDRQPRESVWTTAINVFEVRLGLSALEKGKRRDRLEKAFQVALENVLEGRILPFDEIAAIAAGELAAKRKRQGRIIDMRDTQIAGIAIARRAKIATRNIKDFQGLAHSLMNPWDNK